MSLRVIRPGLLTSVQDLGRWGKQRYGVVVGGAMDPLALRLANLLVGNDEGAAALEMTLLGPALKFERDAMVALCGGEFRPKVGEQILPMGRPVFVAKGTTLTFGPATSGCRGYLAISGGLDVPLVLRSRSTYLLGKFGGFEGRALKEGDVLSLGRSNLPIAPHDCCWSIGSVAPTFHEIPTLKVIPGSELDWLAPHSREQLFHADFEVTPQSDRMGYRLSGPKLELQAPRELISEAVCPGTIQLPADGQPILLMADCATTGGYPKMACVATVDLPLAAQLRPGDKFRLALITLEEAQMLYRQREAEIARVKVGLSFKLSRRDHAAKPIDEAPRGRGG